MNILIILIIKLVYCYEFSFSKFNNFGKNFIINDKLNNIFKNNNKIIIESSYGDNNWRNNYINLYFKRYNKKLLNLNYNNFINNEYDLNNDIIYINDFLINDGRILLNNEKEKILNYDNNIILGCEELNKIPYKDPNFLKNFEKIQLDKIEKREIMNYIYTLVNYYKYDDILMLINWNKFDIELLDFEICEENLYLLNLYLKNNKDLNENEINNLIHKFLSI